METNMGLSRDEVWLKKLTDAVKGNLENEQFGVSELSAAVAISRFQLHRKLKSLKGKSVSQFIREVRLEEAMKMLRADVARSLPRVQKCGRMGNGFAWTLVPAETTDFSFMQDWGV